jgi:hypothetical protein
VSFGPLIQDDPDLLLRAFVTMFVYIGIALTFRNSETNTFTTKIKDGIETVRERST